MGDVFKKRMVEPLDEGVGLGCMECESENAERNGCMMERMEAHF